MKNAIRNKEIFIATIKNTNYIQIGKSYNPSSLLMLMTTKGNIPKTQLRSCQLSIIQCANTHNGRCPSITKIKENKPMEYRYYIAKFKSFCWNQVGLIIFSTPRRYIWREKRSFHCSQVSNPIIKHISIPLANTPVMELLVILKTKVSCLTLVRLDSVKK